MQTDAETLFRESVLTGRIRDALRKLGYAVPAGHGLGTPEVLAAMTPAIIEFTKRHAAQFAQHPEAKDALSRAALFAEIAEAEAARIDPTPGVLTTLGALAAGFVTYRAMKRRAGGRMENLTLSDMMSLITTVSGHRR